MRDLLTDSLNDPAGRLAEVLLKKMTKRQGDQEISDDIRARFERLIHADGRFGELARVRLAADVAFLFDQAPKWTARNIVPLFEWSSPGAHAAWSSRKYANNIGSPKLMTLMRKSFLELFDRDDISDEDLDTFAEWLAAVMLVSQSGRADYPITQTEARTALRRVGGRALSNVGHRLALEMEGANAEDKVATWRNIVGPVFKGIWPLDAELQTSTATFKLVQILRNSGEAFPEAADVIIPFIRPEDPNRHISIHSISQAPDDLYVLAPQKMLLLVAAVVGDTPARSVFGLDKALERIRSYEPKLADTNRFQKLVSCAGMR